MTSDTFIGSSRRKNSVCTTLLFTWKRRAQDVHEPAKPRAGNPTGGGGRMLTPGERNANITNGRCPNTCSVLWGGKSIGPRSPQTWAPSPTCPRATSGPVGSLSEPGHSWWDESVWVRYVQRIQQLYNSRGGCQHICHLQRPPHPQFWTFFTRV